MILTSYRPDCLIWPSGRDDSPTTERSRYRLQRIQMGMRKAGIFGRREDTVETRDRSYWTNRGFEVGSLETKRMDA